MRIIRNYILEEIFSTFLSTLFILTFVLLIGNIFSKMIDLVINRGVDIVSIGELFLFSTPFLFVFTIPMAALVSVLLCFGRLSSDHELVALRANGVGLGRIIKPVLISAMVLSLVALYISDQIASRSHFRVRQITSQIGMQSPTAVLEEGVFIKSFNNLVIFIHRIEENVLHQIRIYQPQKDGPTRTIIAEKGELIPQPDKQTIKLKLTNGTSDEPDANNPDRFYKLKFGTYFLPLDISGHKFRGPLNKKRKELTLKELWDQYLRLKSEGFIDNYTLTVFHQKIAMSCAPFILVLMGIPLAMRANRSEKSTGFAIALCIGTLYWALVIGSVSFAKSGQFPPWTIMHAPNVLLALVGLILIKKQLRT